VVFFEEPIEGAVKRPATDSPEPCSTAANFCRFHLTLRWVRPVGRLVDPRQCASHRSPGTEDDVGRV